MLLTPHAVNCVVFLYVYVFGSHRSCIYIYIYIYSTVRKAKRMVLQCINGVGSNPVEGRTKI